MDASTGGADPTSWLDQLVLDIGACEDLSSLYGWDGNVLAKKSPKIQIVTDVSASGYGAACLDLSGKQASNAPKCTRNDGYFDGNSCI